MIKSIAQFEGSPCLIFDAELLEATRLKLGDSVEVSVAEDRSLIIQPVAATTATAENPNH